MKKQLLFAAILFSIDSQAQQLDASNEPTIGENALMYVCDTLADPYATTTGNGVTWDYSGLLGLSGSSRTIEVTDATTAPNASDFPTSTKTLTIQGLLTNYFNSTPTERVSQGFVYEEPSLGTVLATFNTDNETIMNYPFGLSASLTDAFSGSLSFTFNSVPQNPVCTGNAYSWIDGQGTLLLQNGTSIPNVIRYKIIDTVFTQINFITLLDIEFVRTQYEYYDPSSPSNLPLFIHTTILIEQLGASTPLLIQTNVLSSQQPTQNVGINEIANSNLGIYPNPSEGIIRFKGDFQLNSSAMVYDQTGRKVTSIPSIANGQSVDLSNLNKGIYLVVIDNNGAQTTQSVVLR